ncbi:hypothetical protein BX070DRAFT_48478 [Coemansia spiralis]|nr:hypothetical protein BX070DRAFT_48478 [Coemansia spiralis]
MLILRSIKNFALIATQFCTLQGIWLVPDVLWFAPPLSLPFSSTYVHCLLMQMSRHPTQTPPLNSAKDAFLGMHIRQTPATNSTSSAVQILLSLRAF